jgi:clathrin heavy chain
MPVNA